MIVMNVMKVIKVMKEAKINLKIKSYDELVKIREEHKNKVGLRHKSDFSGEQIEILVGTATCGISSGARETLNAFLSELITQKLINVKVVPVGCLGYCHSEPIVQVNMPNTDPILYGNVKSDRVHEIIESHIKGGKPVSSMLLQINFDRV